MSAQGAKRYAPKYVSNRFKGISNRPRNCFQPEISALYEPVSYRGRTVVVNKSFSFPLIQRNIRVDEAVPLIFRCTPLSKSNSEPQEGFKFKHPGSALLLSTIDNIIGNSVINSAPTVNKKASLSKLQKSLYDNYKKKIYTLVRDVVNNTGFKSISNLVKSAVKFCAEEVLVKEKELEVFAIYLRPLLFGFLVRAFIKTGNSDYIADIFSAVLDVYNNTDKLRRYSYKEIFDPMLLAALSFHKEDSTSTFEKRARNVIRILDDEYVSSSNIVFNQLAFRSHNKSNLVQHIRSVLEHSDILFPETVNRCISNLELIKSKHSRNSIIISIIQLMYNDENAKEYTPNLKSHKPRLIFNKDTFSLLCRYSLSPTMVEILVDRAIHLGLIKYPEVQAALVSQMGRKLITGSAGSINILRLMLSKGIIPSSKSLALVFYLYRDTRLYPHFVSMVSELMKLGLKIDRNCFTAIMYRLATTSSHSTISIDWWADVIKTFELPLDPKLLSVVLRNLARHNDLYIFMIIYKQFMDLLIKLDPGRKSYYDISNFFHGDDINISGMFFKDIKKKMEVFPLILGDGTSRKAVKELKSRFMYELARKFSLDSVWTRHAARAFNNEKMFRHAFRGALENIPHQNLLEEIGKFSIATETKIDNEYIVKHTKSQLVRSNFVSNDQIYTTPIKSVIHIADSVVSGKDIDAALTEVSNLESNSSRGLYQIHS